MEEIKKKLRQARTVLALPEVRIFWVLVPLLAGIFVLVLFGDDLPLPHGFVAFVAAGLLLAVAGIVFTVSYRLARMNFDTKVERNELKSVIATINDALIVYDQDFSVLFFNPAAERLFGVSGTAVIGKEIHPQIADDPQFRLLAQVVFPTLAPTIAYRSKAGSYPQIVDLSFDDPILELRVTTSNIVDDNGSVAGFMKVIENRTQEVSLMRSKNEFITVASHQLRTPITEVNWAIDTVLQEPQLPAGAKDLLVQTGLSAKKILNIVEDLLNIAKMEEGHFNYQLQGVDLTDFLDNILGTALPQVERAGLKLYFDRPKEALPAVSIDTHKVSMVIANLIDNAVRYNVEHGEITVRLRRSDDPRFAEISVKDTGIGIPPEEIKKLFSKFYRGSNAMKFQTDGSGLGLWIARSIVRAHGGEMWAESELNRGTRFSFTIPIDPLLIPTAETANLAEPLG